jgi:hypothetical protein
MAMTTVEISNRAKKDLRRIGPGVNRTHIASGLRDLADGVANLAVKPVTGHPPWLELRIGDFRFLYRPIEDGWWVERIVNRKDLFEAIRTLT